MVGGAIVGREAELLGIGRFLDDLVAGSATLVVEGEAGIGKTTLWNAGVGFARERAFHVLRAQPAEAEAKLSYSALTDLMESVADATLPALPDPQRRALEVVLLRAAQADFEIDQRTVAVAFLGVLRHLSRSTPVIVAVDDVQWLDAPSADVLGFVARRLGTAPVGILAARRCAPQHHEPVELAPSLSGERSTRLALMPLGVAAIREVTRTAFGSEVPHYLAARMHEATGGNPFYAIEIARALRGREPAPDETLEVPEDLAALVRVRLSLLAKPAQDAIFLSAALSEPTVAILEALGNGGGWVEAESAGVLYTADGRIRFTHPLLGSIALAEAGVEHRRALHRAIAMVIGNTEERARHLALASSGPDADVASALDQAAALARARGAPAAAAKLCDQARRLTPPSLSDDVRRRSLAAAQLHFSAGQRDEAHRALTTVLKTTPPGRDRAFALRLLGLVHLNDESYPEARRVLQESLNVFGDDLALTVATKLDLAYAQAMTRDIPGSNANVMSALSGAELLGDQGLLAEALAAMAITDFLIHGEVARDAVERSLDLEDKTRPCPIQRRPSFIAAMLLTWTGQLPEANAAFEALHGFLVDRGEEISLFYVSTLAIQASCWAGDLRRATSYADSVTELAARLGGGLNEASALAAQAWVHAHTGHASAAYIEARKAADLFRLAGSDVFEHWSTGILGFAALSAGDAAAAHDALNDLSDIAIASGLRDPVYGWFLAHDIEALVILGQHAHAETLLQYLDRLSVDSHQAMAQAIAARCWAQLLAARGDIDAAVAAAERAIADHRRLSMPIERGRALLVLGQLHRRRKKKALAKQVLEEACAVFDHVGAAQWSSRARSELARVGVRPTAPLDLTSTEAQVAALAAAGMTTREVAQRVFLTPKSAEGVLGRVYRKLAVHSRAELANVMARRAQMNPAERSATDSGEPPVPL
ncbi:MAG: AAA family ATPase [Actinomycetota bacterium]|nr:AAA family ATPase [Actinomycetota bacterium]MDQ6945056.1 AAA family ATPase [Actinomycetota bacterium]